MTPTAGWILVGLAVAVASWKTLFFILAVRAEMKNKALADARRKKLAATLDVPEDYLKRKGY